MYGFACADDFIKAVETETRPLREIEHDETLRRGVGEHRLWKTDNWEQLAFVDDFRRKLDRLATCLYRPRPHRPGRRVINAGHGRKTMPREATQHLFELFGIDWQAPIEHSGA